MKIGERLLWLGLSLFAFSLAAWLLDLSNRQIVGLFVFWYAIKLEQYARRGEEQP